MLKKIWFLALVFGVFLISIAPVQSFKPVYECLNDSYMTVSLVLNVSGNITRIDQPPVFCPYGCNAGECRPVNNTSSSLALAILFASVFLALIYASMKFAEPHNILSWLFLLVALSIIVVGFIVQVNTGAHMQATNNILSGVGWAMIILIIVLIAYFYIYFVRNLKCALPYGKRKPKYS